MRLDQALEFNDSKVHEAVLYALDHLAAAQFPNGAWPQRFNQPPDPAKFPVKKASYPPSWPREFPSANYGGYYTFNDNALADCIDVMFEAGRLYDVDRYTAAARRGGDFILLAQMPEPQPIWAQQYDVNMHPVWARKFEPPSVTGGETQGVLRILLKVYRETGDRKYLQPFHVALDYLRRSRLQDGRLARFYELQTNRPLYFTKEYKLTYSDADMPTHYGFKVSDNSESIAREYNRLQQLSPEELSRRDEPRPSRGKPSRSQVEQVRSVIAALDDRGAWVEEGRLQYHGPDDPTRRVIDSRTFIKNVGTLSGFLARTRP
jgi:hypothetical protein